MAIPTDPLRMCHTQVQNVCITGSLLARNLTLLEPFSIPPSLCSNRGNFLALLASHTHAHTHTRAHTGTLSSSGQVSAAHCRNSSIPLTIQVMPRTMASFFCPFPTPEPPPLHYSVVVVSHRKGKSWTHYIILHSASSSWGIRSEVIVGSGG